MKKTNLSQPLDAVVFDCDGTLSSIEGVVYLAEQNGVGEEISEITERVMSTGGLNPQIYAERLALIQPTKQQINDLIDDYYLRVTPNTKQVITLLQKLHKEVFIVSAGLYPSVRGFAEQLGVPDKNIFAVDLSFDDNGNYVTFDKSSPLTYDTGKQTIIKNITKDYPRIAYVGDGANDLSVKDLVTCFIGYGGAFYRENIKAQSDFYIEEANMLPLLPWVLTSDELELSSSIAA